MGLVRASGASKSLVNQWVSGVQKSISIERALRIEATLGISHVWLMTGMGDPVATPGQVIVLPPEKRDDEPRLTLALPAELDLLELFRRSTDREQTNILSVATLAEKRPAANIRSGKK